LRVYRLIWRASWENIALRKRIDFPVAPFYQVSRMVY